MLAAILHLQNVEFGTGPLLKGTAGGELILIGFISPRFKLRRPISLIFFSFSLRSCAIEMTFSRISRPKNLVIMTPAQLQPPLLGFFYHRWHGFDDVQKLCFAA